MDESGPYRFRVTYDEESGTGETAIAATAIDLSKGDFFPQDTTVGQYVALFAQGVDWKVLAAGRDGQLAWVSFRTTATSGGATRDVFILTWGQAPSSWAFGAQADSPERLAAAVNVMVSAASEL